MTSLHTMGIIKGVLEGQYQAGIGYLPVKYPELEARELLDEDLMLCIPARHRLFRSDFIVPQDLNREPLIGVSEHALPEVYREIIAYFEVLGIDLNVIAQPFTFYEAIHMAAAGRGIAMVSSGWSHLTKDGIAFRPMADKLLTMKTASSCGGTTAPEPSAIFRTCYGQERKKLRSERQKMTLTPRHGSALNTGGQRTIPSEDNHAQIYSRFTDCCFDALRMQQREEAECRQFHEGNQSVSCQAWSGMRLLRPDVSRRCSRIRIESQSGTAPQMAAFERAGLVRGSDTTSSHSRHDGRIGPSAPRPVRRYELTDMGKKYLQVKPGILGQSNAFCYGQKAVDSIANGRNRQRWDRIRRARSLTAIKLRILAIWAQQSGVQQAFPDIQSTLQDTSKPNQIAGLVLTNKGWEVPEQ